MNVKDQPRTIFRKKGIVLKRFALFSLISPKNIKVLLHIFRPKLVVFKEKEKEGIFQHKRHKARSCFLSRFASLRKKRHLPPLATPCHKRTVNSPLTAIDLVDDIRSNLHITSNAFPPILKRQSCHRPKK